jgi:hypothetical protein
MIKAMANLPDGGALLVLGLTAENVEELKQNRSICFLASEMRLPLPGGTYIVVSYIHPNGLIATPADEDLPIADQLVIAINDAELARLTTQRFEAQMPGTTIRLCVIYRETQHELERLFVRFIGPITRTIGFDVSRN